MTILAECYADTLLTKQLKYNFLPYHSGIGEVANQMKKYYHNRKAIAIIDDDKNKPSYFSTECTQIGAQNGVVLLKHKQADHYVIKITPAFENFIDQAATECGYEVFEKNKEKFRAITKSTELHYNSKFINYLNRIIQKKPAGIETIKKFIRQAEKAPLSSIKKAATKKRKK